MPTDDVQRSGTLDAGFAAAVATGWSTDDVVSVDHGRRLELSDAAVKAILPPRPKLLVPVDVQALVVRQDGSNGEHVDVAVTTLDRMQAGADVDPAAPDDRAAPPFGPVGQRDPGVHLHWVMPDGLTQGRVAGEGTDGELSLRALPDRWLVARVQGGVPHRVTAWVVESDRGRSVPLADWPLPPSPDDPQPIPSSELTAMTGGDAAWAAVYDNVVDRFAFHDDLDGVDAGERLSYLVVGWYADAGLDPLDAITGPGNVAAVLDELRWDCPELDKALARWQKQQERAQLLASIAEDASSPSFRKATDAMVGALADESPKVAVVQERWYPTRSVYHGRIEGVRADGHGPDRRPSPDTVRVSLGPTSAESHAALVAGARGEDAERLQVASMFDLLAELDEADGVATLDEEVHRRGFASRDGGVTVETILEGDRLAPFRGADRPTKRPPDGDWDPTIRDDLLDLLAAGEPIVNELFVQDPFLRRDLEDVTLVGTPVLTDTPLGPVVGGIDLGDKVIDVGVGPIVGGPGVGDPGGPVVTDPGGGPVVGGPGGGPVVGGPGGGPVVGGPGGGPVVGGPGGGPVIGGPGGGPVVIDPGGPVVGPGGPVIGGPDGPIIGGPDGPVVGGPGGPVVGGPGGPILRPGGGVVVEGLGLADGELDPTVVELASSAGFEVTAREGGGFVVAAVATEMTAAIPPTSVALVEVLGDPARAHALTTAFATARAAVTVPRVTSTFTVGGREGLVLHPEVRDRLKELFPSPGDLRGDGAMLPRTIERPAPRWFRPQDPVLTFEGLARSLRAGHDGRFGADEPLLACRLSGGVQDVIVHVLRGDQVVGRALRRTGVPPEAQGLLHELVLADDTFVDDHVAHVRIGPSRRDLPVVDVLRAETRLHRWQGAVEAQMEPLHRASGAVGEAASPVGVTFWQQPWVPLYVEWEVVPYDDPDPTTRRLGELDLAPLAELGTAGEPLKGRSLLMSAASKALAKATATFLADEEERGGVTSLRRDEATSLARITSDAPRIDRLVAGLDGLLDHALGFRANEAVVPEGDGEPEVHPTADPRLLRSGAIAVRKLRVVDAFGRFVDLDTADLVVARSADSELTAPDQLPLLDLPPRVTADTRLWLRFVDAEDRTHDARLDQSTGGRSPVAGWLLSDHVDRSMEVFDADGLPLGQLRHATLGGDVVWEGAPGSERSAAPLPTVEEAGETLAAFAAGLVARDAAERAGAAGSSDDAETEERESPLSALLRAVDTTLWTVDPFGEAGDEHLAMLVGHPIAVVRARVTLEVFDDTDTYTDLDPVVAARRRAAFRELGQVPFEVRLGALTRVRDGLLGWFVDDDYQVFHPVHPRVLAEAEPGGVHGTVGDDRTVDPITSPYAVPDATVTLHPGETRWLTLLLSPAGRLHATSGVVPRKSVGLLREWTARALARIAPSFRVGPVLVDPTTIRMPRPSAEGEPTWTHRGTPTTWVDDPLLPSSTDALLPDREPVLQEGWIRLARS